MNNRDFTALQSAYDAQAGMLEGALRRRFPGPDWDVLRALTLWQRNEADLLYRDVHFVRMGYCGARLDKMITGQILRDAKYDPIGCLGKEMCAEMDTFQRQVIADTE